MAFSVDDYLDLLRLLSDHPEWRTELRRALFPDDFESLPDVVRRLAEAQERTEARLNALAEAQQKTEERLVRLEETVARLAEAQERMEARLNALAEAQQKTEERLVRLEETVARLAEAQERMEARLNALAEAQQKTEERLVRLEEAVARLAEAQERMEARLGHLETTVRRLDTTVGELRGRELERHHREAAPGIFGHLLRRARALTRDAVADLVEDALSPKEAADVALLDVVVRGRIPADDGPATEVLLAGEVSATVDLGDVERAERRARLLQKAGYLAIPMAAGLAATHEAQEGARAANVVLLQDGRTLFWDEALEAWLHVPPHGTPRE